MMELQWLKEGTMVAGRIPVTSEEVPVVVIYAVILSNQGDCFNDRDFKQRRLGFVYLQRKGKRRMLDSQTEVPGGEVGERVGDDERIMVPLKMRHMSNGFGEVRLER
ncbi:unnamed protein product [Lactuca virosa]|uniref:Uncharacterized protein n=1 Tax=Lactuca virosa TaxID=75947 RepID=A0AAU9N9J0_9ASTR|nr:unnamed protein product [Lactuca virosa]